jgi:hypothetical protein
MTLTARWSDKSATPSLLMFTRTRMSRSAALLVLLGVLLDGCNAPPVSLADVPQFGEVKTLFLVGQDVQVINVRALDRLAITAADLVLPDGTRVPAYSIDSRRNPTISRWAQGDRAFAGSSDVIGVGGISLPPNAGAPEESTVFLGQIASAALIRVPELAAYRLVWQQAKVEVRLGLGEDRRVEKLSAPPPPP